MFGQDPHISWLAPVRLELVGRRIRRCEDKVMSAFTPHLPARIPSRVQVSEEVWRRCERQIGDASEVVLEFLLLDTYTIARRILIASFQ